MTTYNVPLYWLEHYHQETIRNSHFSNYSKQRKQREILSNFEENSIASGNVTINSEKLNFFVSTK